MKAIVTSILIVSLSIMAIAGKNKAKLYNCPECEGSKRVKYDTFYQKCKTCNGVGKATKKQIYKSDSVNFYLYKKDYRGKYSPVKIKSGKYATKKAVYDKKTKIIVITKIATTGKYKKIKKSFTNKHGDGFKKYKNSKKSMFDY